MFEVLHGLCINSAEDCRACPLGNYELVEDDNCKFLPKRHSRCAGRGKSGSPIMLIGEMPEDVGEYGVYNHQLALFLRALSEDVLIRSLQENRISPDLIYGTTALKCQGFKTYERLYPMPKLVMNQCRELHLGVEIEAMQPAVIWMTNYHAADMVQRHFKLKNRLKPKQMYLMDAPKIWRFKKILLIRSVNPKHRFDSDSIAESVAFIGLYLREFVYGNR